MNTRHISQSHYLFNNLIQTHTHTYTDIYKEFHMKVFNLNLYEYKYKYEYKCKGSPSLPLHFPVDAAKLLPQACPTLLLVTVDIVVIQCITTWWRLSSHDWQVTPVYSSSSYTISAMDSSVCTWQVYLPVTGGKASTFNFDI